MENKRNFKKKFQFYNYQNLKNVLIIVRMFPFHNVLFFIIIFYFYNNFRKSIANWGNFDKIQLKIL